MGVSSRLTVKKSGERKEEERQGEGKETTRREWKTSLRESLVVMRKYL